ncbi:hypothetical protein GIB67_015334 [Kingdonia uniflora]|uniref:Peptidase C14 caspase domain-containing protein n=1 Tax=Kingdonia uniflora TaxID=39325 RepID=A0A7J7KYN8_9MAGN|nr:hypothetical protein GIB67_015334 [Kingdonia uniflora]
MPKVFRFFVNDKETGLKNNRASSDREAKSANGDLCGAVEIFQFDIGRCNKIGLLHSADSLKEEYVCCIARIDKHRVKNEMCTSAGPVFGAGWGLRVAVAFVVVAVRLVLSDLDEEGSAPDRISLDECEEGTDGSKEETDQYRLPTKHNMRMALYWLVQGCQPGDSLVFHYSGHGSRQRNYNGDEVDGFDETLCPLDFETQGMIVDDEINTTIVKPLTHGVKLHAIIDACHSGTVLDLPFLCRMSRSGQYVWEDHRPRSGVWKGTNGGEAISFSGCDDDQTSADTSALSKITSTGAMTYCFIQAFERGHGATYGSILNSMRTTIRNTGNDLGGGPVTSLLTMLLAGGSVGGGLKQVQTLIITYCLK